jgi:hypothetical protein
MKLGTDGSLLLSLGDAAVGTGDGWAASRSVTLGDGGRKIELEGSRT